MKFSKKLTRFGDLLGQTLQNVERRDGVDGEELVFTLADGACYRLYHTQDCCETVYIDDICGELQDLVGVPLTLAEESSNGQEDLPDVEHDQTAFVDSFTWTFYRLATVKGYVTIRWYGCSDGYYSETVDFAAC